MPLLWWHRSTFLVEFPGQTDHEHGGDFRRGAVQRGLFPIPLVQMDQILVCLIGPGICQDFHGPSQVFELDDAEQTAVLLGSFAGDALDHAADPDSDAPDFTKVL